MRRQLNSQKQSGGDGSLNIQADTVVVKGTSVDEVRALIRAEVGPMFEEMSAKAAETARERAAEIGDQIVERLAVENPNALSAANDPDFQYALITEQREYARSGSEDLRDLLVDILHDRAAYRDDALIQLVLNEALVVAPKLTAGQLAGLTAMFLVGRTRALGIRSVDELARWLEAGVGRFMEYLPTGSTWFQHLQYTGCVQSGGLATVRVLTELQRRTYPGLFSKGLSEDDVTALKDDVPKASTLLMPCLNDPSKVQIVAIDSEVLKSISASAGLSADEIKIIEDGYLGRNMMNDDEAIDAISH